MTHHGHPQLDGLGNYEYGWFDEDDKGANAERGLDERVVRGISIKKNEPQWMLDLRLKDLALFEKKPMPTWGSDLSGINFVIIKYFVRSTEKQAQSTEQNLRLFALGLRRPRTYVGSLRNLGRGRP